MPSPPASTHKRPARKPNPRPTPTLGARLAAAESRFSEAGAAFSEVTRAAYRQLLKAKTPLTAYDLIEVLQVALDKRLHPPTIYHALTQLMAQGLVHRIESANTYFPCRDPHGPHDGIHFLCTQCGAVEEAVDTRVAALVGEAALDLGFAPERPVIEVRGVCRSCRS